MLDSDMREAREGEINIQDMDSTTVGSMIHYIYTGKMSEDWQDLDIQGMDSTTIRSMIQTFYNGKMSEDWQDLDIKEVARAADMYDLPGLRDQAEGWRRHFH